MKTSAIFGAAALVLAATAAVAQATTSTTTTATATSSGSAGAQAAAFRCGGVGQGEQERMKAQAHEHALMLTFASADGAYLADVDVEILRGGRTVVQGHCGGPIMLVDLAPAGTYEVVATAQGRTQRQSVNVGGKPASVTLHWPR